MGWSPYRSGKDFRTAKRPKSGNWLRVVVCQGAHQFVGRFALRQAGPEMSGPELFF
jgi:hypothetical protein